MSVSPAFYAALIRFVRFAEYHSAFTLARLRISEILCKVTAFSSNNKPKNDFYITLLYKPT
jgi:hypothetical protein